MGDSQQFCLKWNNHHSNMLSVFDDLYKQQSFCDVTLACDGTVIRAHKNVLSACSPFFHAVFMANPCKHPVVILKDIRFSDLKALVEFMYRGEVNVSQDELPVLLKVAEALKIRGLAGSENGAEEPVRRRSKRKRRRKSQSDGESAGSGSDTEPELVRTPITKKPSHVDQSSLPLSSSAAVPSSSHHDVHSHPKDDVHHTPASTPPVIRSANAAGSRQQQQEQGEEAEFEPTDILEATMATHLQSSNAPTVSDTRQSSSGAQGGNAQSDAMTEALVIPDDTELDIKPIINFEPSAVPSTSQAGALQPTHSGASNSSSSMMDSNMDSSDMTTFAEAGLPSTSGGAAGSTPHEVMLELDVMTYNAPDVPSSLGSEVVAIPTTSRPSNVPVRAVVPASVRAVTSALKKCAFCSFATSDIDQLRLHSARHYKQNELYACSQCSYVARYKHSVVIHMRKHTKEQPYQCTHCARCFNHLNSLKRHISNIHPFVDED